MNVYGEFLTVRPYSEQRAADLTNRATLPKLDFTRTKQKCKYIQSSTSSTAYILLLSLYPRALSYSFCFEPKHTVPSSDGFDVVFTSGQWSANGSFVDYLKWDEWGLLADHWWNS